MNMMVNMFVLSYKPYVTKKLCQDIEMYGFFKKLITYIGHLIMEQGVKTYNS